LLIGTALYNLATDGRVPMVFDGVVGPKKKSQLRKREKTEKFDSKFGFGRFLDWRRGEAKVLVPSRQKFRNVRPLIAILDVGCEYHAVLFRCPCFFPDVRVEMIVPPAITRCHVRQYDGHQRTGSRTHIESMVLMMTRLSSPL